MVTMLRCCRRPAARGLTAKPMVPIVFRAEIREQELDGHRTIQRRIPGEIDLSHPAPSDQAKDLVAADGRRMVAHGGSLERIGDFRARFTHARNEDGIVAL